MSANGVVPWLVVGPDRVPVEPVRRFLTDFVARDNRPGSVRSYAYGLLRWWRWLRAVGVDFSFAPCVDLDYGLSEVIGDRAFHRDADAVAARHRAGCAYQLSKNVHSYLRPSG